MKPNLRVFNYCWTLGIRIVRIRYWYILKRVSVIIFVNKPNRCTIFSYMFISILYVFQAAMCPSSGEAIVSMRHLVYVTLCRWPSGVQVGSFGVLDFHSALHTRRSSTQSDIYQVSHWYSYFSWWWAHGCPKHVENRNKHIRKNCASSWFIYKDYTKMHGQQYVKVWGICSATDRL
jgi:hypothetical protein